MFSKCFLLGEEKRDETVGALEEKERAGERGRHYRRTESMNDLISEAGGTSAPSFCCCSVIKSCLILCNPMDCWAPLSMEFFRQEYWSVLAILAILFSRGAYQPRD